MNLVARYGGEPVDFTIGNGSVGLLLIGGDFRRDLVVSSATRFVFVRPRPGAPHFRREAQVGDVLARPRRGLHRRRRHQGISENVDQHHDMRRLWVCPRCRVGGS